MCMVCVGFVWKAREAERRKEESWKETKERKGKDHRQMCIGKGEAQSNEQPTKHTHTHTHQRATKRWSPPNRVDLTHHRAHAQKEGKSSQAPYKERKQKEPEKQGKALEHLTKCCFYYHCELLLPSFLQVSFHISCMWKPGPWVCLPQRQTSSSFLLPPPFICCLVFFFTHHRKLFYSPFALT